MANSPLTHAAIPVIAELEVLVVGAGSAGCCAAIAAAEVGRGANLRVGLVERYGFAGGVSTQTLDTFYGFYTPGDAPRKVVGGIPDRVIDALARTGDMFLRPNTYGAGTGITYNPERLKLVWDQLLAAAGVRVWFHALLVDVTTDAAGVATGVVIFTKGGFARIAARRIIDASGDADVCHWLGLDYELAGEIDPAQTLTTTFRMCNVDLAKFADAGGKNMLAAKMDAALATGRHSLPRKAGSAHAMVQAGCIATVAVRVADVDATNADELTAAEQEGRRQAFVLETFFRDMVPGYENAKIIGLSHQIGVRETRRVYGEYRLTREDCLAARQFEDAVLLCGAPIEDHRAAPDGAAETHWEYVRDNQAYGVPYRTLVPRGRDELWVAGRCFSATHDAHASCRSMGQTMSMGQAAGAAAAISLRDDAGARDVSISKLQAELRELGAVLELPVAVADVRRDAWTIDSRRGLSP
ncbi:MAG: FAD-dependent oxidoreductase [Pirellulales bacterium]